MLFSSVACRLCPWKIYDCRRRLALADRQKLGLVRVCLWVLGPAWCGLGSVLQVKGDWMWRVLLHFDYAHAGQLAQPPVRSDHPTIYRELLCLFHCLCWGGLSPFYPEALYRRKAYDPFEACCDLSFSDRG